MKKSLVLGVIAFVALGIGAGTFAYQQTSGTSMACCKGSDSCPLKSKAAAGHDTASCCENCDCCEGHHAAGAASCPMHDKADQPKAAAAGDATVVVHGESCSCPCCASKSGA